MSDGTDFVVLAAAALVKRLDDRAAIMAAADGGDKSAIKALHKIISASEGKSWTEVPELHTLRAALAQVGAVPPQVVLGKDSVQGNRIGQGERQGSEDRGS
jgi:hypothetical protein